MRKAIATGILLSFCWFPVYGQKMERVFSGSEGYIEKPFRRHVHKSPVLLGTVYFAYGSAKVSKEARKKVRKVAEKILSFPINGRDEINAFEARRQHQIPSDRIRIIGYADNSGTSAFNLQLGLRRAEAVAKALEDYGIPLENARVASFGETRSYGKAGQFRRVEIWYVPASRADYTYLYVVFVFVVLLFGGIILYSMQRPRRPRYF